MAGNLADCMPTASCRLRPTPTRPSSEAPTSPARCSQARSHCFSLPCSFTCPSFPPRAACHDCWHLTTFISSSLEARSILCPQPVCKNLSRTRHQYVSRQRHALLLHCGQGFSRCLAEDRRQMMSTTTTSGEQQVVKQQLLAAFEHGCSVPDLLSTT